MNCEARLEMNRPNGANDDHDLSLKHVDTAESVTCPTMLHDQNPFGCRRSLPRAAKKCSFYKEAEDSSSSPPSSQKIALDSDVIELRPSMLELEFSSSSPQFGDVVCGSSGTKFAYSRLDHKYLRQFLRYIRGVYDEAPVNAKLFVCHTLQRYIQQHGGRFLQYDVINDQWKLYPQELVLRKLSQTFRDFRATDRGASSHGDVEMAVTPRSWVEVRDQLYQALKKNNSLHQLELICTTSPIPFKKPPRSFSVESTGKRNKRKKRSLSKTRELSPVTYSHLSPSSAAPTGQTRGHDSASALIGSTSVVPAFQSPAVFKFPDQPHNTIGTKANFSGKTKESVTKKKSSSTKKKAQSVNSRASSSNRKKGNLKAKTTPSMKKKNAPVLEGATSQTNRPSKRSRYTLPTNKPGASPRALSFATANMSPPIAKSLSDSQFVIADKSPRVFKVLGGTPAITTKSGQLFSPRRVSLELGDHFHSPEPHEMAGIVGGNLPVASAPMDTPLSSIVMDATPRSSNRSLLHEELSETPGKILPFPSPLQKEESKVGTGDGKTVGHDCRLLFNTPTNEASPTDTSLGEQLRAFERTHFQDVSPLNVGFERTCTVFWGIDETDLVGPRICNVFDDFPTIPEEEHASITGPDNHSAVWSTGSVGAITDVSSSHQSLVLDDEMDTFVDWNCGLMSNESPSAKQSSFTFGSSSAGF